MLKFFAEKMWIAFAVNSLTVNEMTLNELFMLTMLEQLGPDHYYFACVQEVHDNDP